MSPVPRVAIVFPPLFAAAVAQGGHAAPAALAAFLRTHGVAVSVLDLNRRFAGTVLAWLHGTSFKSSDPLQPMASYLRRYQTISALNEGLVDALMAIGGHRGLFSLERDLGAVDDPSKNAFLSFTEAELQEEIRVPVELAAISIASFDQLLAGLTAAKVLRSAGLANSIVIGGAAIALCPPKLLRRMLARDDIDGACIGEGEYVLLRLARNSKTKAVKAGLLTCGGREAPRAPPIDLDELPTPDYSDIPAVAWSAPSLALPVRFSSGCIWGQCSFCESRRVNPHVRFRSAERVCDDMITLAQRHGIRRFQLIGDTLPPRYADRLAGALMRKGADLEWWSYLRVDPSFDQNLLVRMSAAGCARVTLGVESSQPRLLRVMNKGYPATEIAPMIERLLACGIAPKVNIILDFPTQTLGEAMADLRFVEGLMERGVQVAAFPFVLSRWSTIGADPAAFGLAVEGLGGGSDCLLSYKHGPHLMPFRNQGGLARHEATQMLALYSALRIRDARCRDLRRRLAESTFPWDQHRYRVRNRDVYACAATRRVYNVVQQRTHELNPSGWAIFCRLLEPEKGVRYSELLEALRLHCAAPSLARIELEAFLHGLAGAGLLHIAEEAGTNAGSGAAIDLTAPETRAAILAEAGGQGVE